MVGVLLEQLVILQRRLLCELLPDQPQRFVVPATPMIFVGKKLDESRVGLRRKRFQATLRPVQRRVRLFRIPVKFRNSPLLAFR